MKAVNYDIDIVIASQEELRCFSGNINLNYSRYARLSAILKKLWTSRAEEGS